MIFTPEELEELRRADAEIEESYRAQHAAYREANKKKIAARNAAYYKANKEKIAARQAAYREANREKLNAHMREYRRRKRAAKKAGDCANG